MKAKDVAVGARITDPKYRYKTGTILSNNVSEGDKMVTVEWDNSYSWDKVETVNVNSLRIVPIPLEEDFQKVNEQLKIAAQAIRAAGKIANDKGTSLREWDGEEMLSFQEVFNEIDGAGWQTSTMTRSC
jgi:hypothetical protein